MRESSCFFFEFIWSTGLFADSIQCVACNSTKWMGSIEDLNKHRTSEHKYSQIIVGKRDYFVLLLRAKRFFLFVNHQKWWDLSFTKTSVSGPVILEECFIKLSSKSNFFYITWDNFKCEMKVCQMFISGENILFEKPGKEISNDDSK